MRPLRGVATSNMCAAESEPPTSELVMRSHTSSAREREFRCLAQVDHRPKT
jgi:hypothetical protein